MRFSQWWTCVHVEKQPVVSLREAVSEVSVVYSWHWITASVNKCILSNNIQQLFYIIHWITATSVYLVVYSNTRPLVPASASDFRPGRKSLRRGNWILTDARGSGWCPAAIPVNQQFPLKHGRKMEGTHGRFMVLCESTDTHTHTHQIMWYNIKWSYQIIYMYMLLVRYGTSPWSYHCILGLSYNSISLGWLDWNLHFQTHPTSHCCSYIRVPMRTPNLWVSKRDREVLDLSIKTSYVDRSRVQTVQVAIIWGITIHKPIYFRVPEGGS